MRAQGLGETTNANFNSNLQFHFDPKAMDVLVEDPEEVEKEKFLVKLISKKHAKKLEYSTKSPKKLMRLSKGSKNL